LLLVVAVEEAPEDSLKELAVVVVVRAKQ